MKHKGQWNLEFTPPGGAEEGFSAWCGCKHPMGSCPETLDCWEIDERINAFERHKESQASARAIMQRFVDKVDTGRARSTETYREMKQWMEEE